MKCELCGRDLSDPQSIANRVGPECAEKKQSFCAAAGTSETELGELILRADETITRWVSLFAGSMRAGRIDHAKRFIDAARRAAAVS